MGHVKQVLGAGVAAVAIVVLAGCGSRNVGGDMPGRAAEEFRAAGEATPVDRFADQQIAAGARTDATLRPYHFDNAVLNSLGRAKLDSMLEDDDEDGGLVVYLDVPGAAAAAGSVERDGDGQLADARRQSVTRYLSEEQGLGEGKFRLESGHNPNNTIPATSVEPKQGDPTASDKAYGEGLGQGFGKALTESMTK